MAENKRSYKSIIKQLIAFSLPLIMSGVLQQLYSWADAFIIGNVEGELALGAIGATGMITTFYIITINGFTVGLSVLFGQAFGAGQTDKIRKALSSFLILLTGIYTTLVVVGNLFLNPLMTLLNTPIETFAPAVQYLRIVLFGVPFLVLYNLHYAALRGIGESRLPFYAVLVSSVTNVLLDIVFVALFHMGISGAALATVISQACMAIFVTIYCYKKVPLLHFNLKHDSFDLAIIREGLHFGIPMMLQSSVASLGNFFLHSFMNSFGAATLIAITTSYRIESLMMVPVQNLGAAVCTMCAQSYGAKDNDRLQKTRKAGTIMLLGFTAFLTMLIIPFGSRLTGLFGAGPEAVEISRQHFVRIAAFYSVYGILVSMRSYIQGIGDVKFSSAVGMIDFAARIIANYTLVGIIGRNIIAFGEAIGWCVGLVLYSFRWKHAKQRVISHMKQTDNYVPNTQTA